MYWRAAKASVFRETKEVMLPVSEEEVYAYAEELEMAVRILAYSKAEFETGY